MAVYTIKVCTKTGDNKVVVYSGDTVVRVMKCSTKKDNDTYYDDEGICKIIEKVKDTNSPPYWHKLNGSVYGQFCSRIGGGNKNYHGLLFHSVPYYSTSHKNLEVEEFNKLGSAASLGCVRLCVRDTKWIYDNCDVGSSVEFVKTISVGQEPISVPTITTDPTDPKYGWDPTDPDEQNPYDNEYSDEFGGNPYPYIVDEAGQFIDSNYPDLSSPAFLTKGTNGSINNSIGVAPSTSTIQSEIQSKYGISLGLEKSVLPNCVGYARARWIELSGGTQNYASGITGNAEVWFKKASNISSLSVGTEPKLGAIACWGSNHIAVVERILDDGSFYVSESGYPMTDGEYSSTKEANRILGRESKYQRGVRVGKCNSDGSRQDTGYGKNFQGFIYFPGEFTGSNTTPVWEDLYSEPVERTDATVRTVGYLTDNYGVSETTLTPKATPQVSAVNYTPVLQAIYNYNSLGGVYTSSNSFSENITNTDFDTSGCSGVYKRQAVVDYLLNRGLSRAVVAGICGNISQESGYKPWSVEGNFKDYSGRDKSMDTLQQVIAIKSQPQYARNHGIGLLAWTFPDFEIAMVAYCEQVAEMPWYDTVSGQLGFFLDVQLNNNGWKYSNYDSRDGTFNPIAEKLKSVPNTEAGAIEWCEYFMRKYERPDLSKANLAGRKDEAAFVFNHIIPYQKKENETSADGGGNGTRTQETR